MGSRLRGSDVTEYTVTLTGDTDTAVNDMASALNTTPGAVAAKLVEKGLHAQRTAAVNAATRGRQAIAVLRAAIRRSNKNGS